MKGIDRTRLAKIQCTRFTDRWRKYDKERVVKSEI